MTALLPQDDVRRRSSRRPRRSSNPLFLLLRRIKLIFAPKWVREYEKIRRREERD